jgi:hypothetical protein
MTATITVIGTITIITITGSIVVTIIGIGDR